MPAAQARAIVADLEVLPADRAADRALLGRLALHAQRHWTPGAAVADDGLWLDLTGAAHLFGGEARFCARMVWWFARLGFTARVAVADTPGAAHALARFARDPVVVVAPGGEPQALAPLPLAALRLEPSALVAAARFGFERVADLVATPRGPLVRRLGLGAVTRLVQALGHAAQPIVPVAPFEPPVAELRLAKPIGTAEQIGTVVGDAMAALVERLRERGLGVRNLELSMDRVDGIAQRVVVSTARATRDGTHLARLLALRIDRIEPGLGLEAVRLTALRVEPLAAAELRPMLASGCAPDDLAPLIDRLAGRAGERALFRLAPVESDVPERTVVRVAPLVEPGRWPQLRRPARLLRRPEPLDGVVALLPDAPPRRFVWRGIAHDVVAGDGPERIHGEWWRRDGEVDAVRDYYRVEDSGGSRFWLFRRGDGVDPRTGDLGWHVHGLFG